MDSKQNRLYNLRFNWRSFISQYPRIYSIWNGFRCPSVVLGLSELSTDLVLEGYPRSGNTFAWYALVNSQLYPLRVVHHSHIPARVIEAVKKEIPTLILIRNPKDCVLSYCIYEPRINIKMSLVHWIRFYYSIKGFKHGYVLADFHDIISDFGQVIERVNQRFGTNFEIFEHTSENVRKIYKQIEISLKNRSNESNEIHAIEDKLSRPSESRKQKKKDLEIILNQDDKLHTLLRDAQDLYEILIKD